MNPAARDVSVQELVQQLVGDEQMSPSPLMEVQRSLRPRASGSAYGWTVVVVDLGSGTEYKVGSDWPWETLQRRRPWRYRETREGLEIQPGPTAAPQRWSPPVPERDQVAARSPEQRGGRRRQAIRRLALGT